MHKTLIALILCISIAPPAPAEEETFWRAQQLAEKIAMLVENHGIEGAKRALEESAQTFRDGDLYAWVIDTYGVVVLHPDPIMIGLDLIMLRDLTARVFIAEILLRAHSEDRFWDEYTGVNPSTNKVTVKRQWIIKVGNHVIGAGAWVNP